MVRRIAVAWLLAGGVNEFVLAAELPVRVLLSLFINRVISQAHLDATPFPTRPAWGNTVMAAVFSVGLIWLGVVLSLVLFPASEEKREIKRHA